MGVVCMGLHRGLSSFVALAVLVGVSASLALYLYSSSISIYSVSRPRSLYQRGYAVCYNVSLFRVLVEDSVELCTNSSRSTSYFCIFRIPKPVNLTVVYSSSINYIYAGDRCAATLDELPIHIYGYIDGIPIVVEVKVYEPWTE